MRYLPILQELFESDTVFFMLMGVVFSVIVGLRLKKRKKYIVGSVMAVALYAICEIISNFHTNFMLELILLFIGTVAIGWCIGFIICFLFRVIVTRKKPTRIVPER